MWRPFFRAARRQQPVSKAATSSIFTPHPRLIAGDFEIS
jgi:hypothetical protein